MFSKQSLSYLSQKEKLKLYKFLKKPTQNQLIRLLKSGSIARPQYGLGILMASNQALQLNIKKISIIEIGFYDISSICDLIEYKKIFEKITPIKLELNYYNIPAKLLNSSNSIYDRKDFFKIINENEKKNKIGNVKILDFKELFEQNFLLKPLGFIIFDTRNYTITNKAFELFKKSSSHYLPKTILYFDHLYNSSELEGEYLSIKNYNKKNQKKISDILEFPEQLSLLWSKWLFLAKRLKLLINFKHSKFKKNINLII